MRSLLIVAAFLPVLGLSGQAATQERAPVVAVFNIELKGARLEPVVVDRLSDYLAARMAEGGRYQVVPRDKLKESLVQQKKASYRECFAQSCQIELGQELAAQKTLATQVMKLGSGCKVTATLFDLARATTENSASASGPCTEDGIVAALEVAAARLLGGTAGTVVPAAAASSLSAPVGVSPPAPDVQDAAPRVARSAVTESMGDLTIVGKTASGVPVRLDITDPSGRTRASGSPFKDPRAMPGTWKVAARASGHATVERTAEVRPDDSTLVKLELGALGSLQVGGEPAGAAVRVTGPGGFRDEGGMPWQADGLQAGAYRLEVSRAGYEPVTREVQLAAGAREVVTIRLARADSATLVGHWAGRACQAGGSCWTIDVTIASQTEASVRGQIAYPSLNCLANLEFVRFEGKGAVFRERYVRKGNCVPDGWLWLTPTKRDVLHFKWAWPDGRVDPQTDLTRVP